MFSVGVCWKRWLLSFLQIFDRLTFRTWSMLITAPQKWAQFFWHSVVEFPTHLPFEMTIATTAGRMIFFTLCIRYDDHSQIKHRNRALVKTRTFALVNRNFG